MGACLVSPLFRTQLVLMLFGAYAYGDHVSDPRAAMDGAGMSRIYATDDDGDRFLRYIECDSCGKRIKPHRDIASSGWTKKDGKYPPYGPNDTWQSDYCPEHS